MQKKAAEAQGCLGVEPFHCKSRLSPPINAMWITSKAQLAACDLHDPALHLWSRLFFLWLVEEFPDRPDVRHDEVRAPGHRTLSFVCLSSVCPRAWLVLLPTLSLAARSAGRRPPLIWGSATVALAQLEQAVIAFFEHIEQHPELDPVGQCAALAAWLQGSKDEKAHTQRFLRLWQDGLMALGGSVTVDSYHQMDTFPLMRPFVMAVRPEAGVERTKKQKAPFREGKWYIQLRPYRGNESAPS
jgi:hypothetical protein